MKKILIVGLVILLFLSGCSSNSLAKYNEAVEKTTGLTRGRSSMIFTIENEFNEKGMTEDELRKLYAYKDMEFSFISSFDHEIGEMEADIYLSLGSPGYDMSFYSSKEGSFIRIPIVNKYMKLDLEDFENKAMETGNESDEIQDVFLKIIEEWTAILEMDNVVKGEKSIMSTEDGDVKVVKFTVSPSEDKIRLFLKKIAALARANSEELEKAGGFSFAEFEGENPMDFSEIVEIIEEKIDSLESITFIDTVFIDIDGYIVSDELLMVFEDYDSEEGQIKKTTVSIIQENWENGMKQDIEFPEIAPDEMIEMDGNGWNFNFEEGGDYNVGN
jgi:hypothetical protein